MKSWKRGSRGLAPLIQQRQRRAP